MMKFGPSVHSLRLPHHAMTQTLEVAPHGLCVTLPEQGWVVHSLALWVTESSCQSDQSPSFLVSWIPAWLRVETLTRTNS